jgi:LacI family transcriptional regulator
MAADHLIGQGFQNLAFLDNWGDWNAQERERSFAAEALRRGRTYEYLDMTPAILGKLQQPIQRLAARLEELPKPLGVAMVHDTGWPLLLEACHSARLTIPDQVAAVGVGNNEVLCELGEMSLSSVDINHKRHGYEAAALLDRLMAGEAPPPSPLRVPPSRVVVRRSSDVLAVNESSVRLAVAFMRDHYEDTSVSVDDIVQASGTSRRRLYTLFQQCLDQSIGEALSGLRVEEAKRLLAETDMKIYTIAIRTGYLGHEQLIRAFRRKTGLSPSAFRKRSRAARVDKPGAAATV